MEEGRPEFSLIRNGKEVVSLKSNREISDKITYSDLLYYADGGTAEAPRTWNGPQKIEEKLVFGKLLKSVELPVSPEQLTHLSGENPPPEMKKLPFFGKTDNGAYVIAGGGKSPVKLEFPDSLPEGCELILRIKELKTVTPNGGWVAYFLNAASPDGKTRVGLTPRNEHQTYVSASWPKVPFKVVRDNFTVDYPAVYRIRRSGGNITMLYNNYPVYSMPESEHGVMDRINIYIGTEKPDAFGMLTISGIELREIPAE